MSMVGRLDCAVFLFGQSQMASLRYFDERARTTRPAETVVQATSSVRRSTGWCTSQCCTPSQPRQASLLFVRVRLHVVFVCDSAGKGERPVV